MLGEAAGDAVAWGEGEGELGVLGMVCAVSGRQKAIVATQTPPMR